MKNPDLSAAGATGATHSPTALLDLAELDSLVHFYFREGLAASTRKTMRPGGKNSANSAQSSTYPTPYQ